MNQYSKEIQNDLDTMAEKYGITRGILLFEEDDKTIPHKVRNRVIIFDSKIKPFKARLFAQLFLGCLNISKSFQIIIDQVSTLSIMGIAKDIKNEHELHHVKDRTKN